MPKSRSLGVPSPVMRMFEAFRVTVNHEMLMGVVHREADQTKQFEAWRMSRPCVRRQNDVDGLTIDVLHRDIRQAAARWRRRRPTARCGDGRAWPGSAVRPGSG